MAGVSTDSVGGDAAVGRAVPIVALDFPDAERALEMISLLGESCRFYKIGSELFAGEGPSFVERVRGEAQPAVIRQAAVPGGLRMIRDLE